MQDKNWETQKLLEEKYNGEKTKGFFADADRLEKGVPLAYVIGHIPFLDTTIFLDSHPLIPRTETEYWVEKAIQQMDLNTASELKVLDLCAGSGCIGVATLKAIPGARVDFVELDEHHHPTIQKNIEKNEIDAMRTHILGGNLFEQVNTTYDYIFTNPPYIDPARDRTIESVRMHEPREALYGGYGGIELIESIIHNAPQYLEPSGEIFIEHEPEQAKAVRTLGEKYCFKVSTETDQYGLERYSQLSLADEKCM